MTEQFGKRLKSLRNKRKISQKDFGKIFGVAESTIGMYERNERKPDFVLLTKFADYFEVTTDFLLGRDINKLLNNYEDKDEEEFLKWMNDPTTDLFFKEYIESPEEMKDQLHKIWDIIKQQQK